MSTEPDRAGIVQFTTIDTEERVQADGTTFVVDDELTAWALRPPVERTWEYEKGGDRGSPVVFYQGAYLVYGGQPVHVSSAADADSLIGLLQEIKARFESEGS